MINPQTETDYMNSSFPSPIEIQLGVSAVLALIVLKYQRLSFLLSCFSILRALTLWFKLMATIVQAAEYEERMNLKQEEEEGKQRVSFFCTHKHECAHTQCTSTHTCYTLSCGRFHEEAAAQYIHLQTTTISRGTSTNTSSQKCNPSSRWLHT